MSLSIHPHLLSGSHINRGRDTEMRDLLPASLHGTRHGRLHAGRLFRGGSRDRGWRHRFPAGALHVLASDHFSRPRPFHTGKINAQPLNSPKLIRFTELTEDEYFCTEAGAKAGVTFENTSETEPLVVLRYFGPEVNPEAPEVGAYMDAA